MTPLVSIIIPVYKVEKYIEKCMQSLLDQTYENFEALVVDDGSPDNSITLAKELVGDDPRFIFLEKENGGQGSARNLGLDHARGDYIAFLDSDDSYTPNALERVVTEFKKNSNFNILLSGFNKVDEEGNIISCSHNGQGVVNTASDTLLLKRTITPYFWDKFFVSEYIQNFRFDENIKTYEDVDLIYRVLYKQEVKTFPDCLYNYTQRLGSTTFSIPPTYLDDKMMIVEKAKLFLDSQNIFKSNKDYYNTYYIDEIFRKPLLAFTFYSKGLKEYADNAKRLKKMDTSIISRYNLIEIKKLYGLNSAILVYSFKCDHNLPYILINTKKVIKNKLRRLKAQR